MGEGFQETKNHRARDGTKGGPKAPDHDHRNKDDTELEVGSGFHRKVLGLESEERAAYSRDERRDTKCDDLGTRPMNSQYRCGHVVISNGHHGPARIGTLDVFAPPGC